MNFSKFGIEKRQQKLSSHGSRNASRVFVGVFKIVLIAFVFVMVVLAGAGFGMLKGILDDSPDVSSINIKPKGFKTTIYDQEGNVLDTLSTANSNRIYIYYDEIPQQMVDAFVSIEDERFWKHNGIDIRGIMRAAVKDITSGNFNEGASTVTQQLIKNHVFDVGMNETTKLQKVERKVQEQYLAIDLEKKYTKKQIMEYYLNTIYLGQGANGVEAAAERYFNKKANELSLSEIATIAGITKNPYRFDPVINPEENDNRRIDVLNKMLKLGYITQAEYDDAKADDVYSRIAKVKQENDENFEYNSYYMDALMRSLAKDFEEKYDMTEAEAYNEIYTGGYSVYSVQDQDIQNLVDGIVNDPQYYPEQSTVALSYKLTLLDPDGETNLNYDTNTLLTYYRTLNGDSKYNNIYSDEAEARAAANAYKEAMLDKTAGTFVAEEFSTAIQPQASVTIIDQKTGYVKAINGGRGEKEGNLGFNRATDAKRQPGSTFKVLAAFLPLIDTGGCLARSYNDAPYSYTSGANVKNWYGGYRGWASLRDAIRDSMNIIAVQAMTEVTPEVAFRYLENEGFTTLVDKEVAPNGDVYSDIQQATALGGLTYGITNFEITAAYAGIANMGTYVKPVYYSVVKDHDDNVVIDNTNPSDRSHEECKDTTAWQLLDAMKDVITSGTGTRAKLQTGGVAAGKTGTTSNSYDLWFCGMTPYYTASVWFGYDSNVTIDTQMHKVMWRDIMDAIANLENHDPNLDWEQPDGLEKVTLCEQSGLLPGASCPTVTDWCATDSIPKKHCDGGHENTITICLDSYEIATDNCVNTQTFTIKDDEETGARTLVGATFPYDASIFTSSCHLHPASGEFTIATGASAGGTISGSVSAAKDATVTIYISPSAGYTISDVQVDGASVGPVSEFTFSGVNSNHTISAYFAAVATEAPADTSADTSAPTETVAPTTEQTSQEAPSDGTTTP